MTHTVHPRATRKLSDRTWHATCIVVALIGGVVTAVGAWLAYGGADGQLTLLAWTWSRAAVPDPVAPALMIGGGGALVTAAFLETFRSWHIKPSQWPGPLKLLVAGGGIGAIVLGIIILV